MGSRGVALVGGVVLGLLLPAGLASVGDTQVMRMAQRLIPMGAGEPEAFGTIGGALAGARQGDVIEIPPGVYAESVTVPEGVELRATKPGSVTLIAPPSAVDWTAIAASGSGATIRGIRIAGHAQSPIARGIAVSGNDVIVDDVTFAGAIGVAVDVKGTGLVVQASRFERLDGTGIRLAQDGASLRQNVFKAVNTSAGPAVYAVDGVNAAFDSNVFLHYPHVVEPASRADSLIDHDNYVIQATPKR
jgi:hypothetical protein